MNTQPSSARSGVRLATQVSALLEDKYGRGQVPSVRTIARDISIASDGDKISHGQISNILNGNTSKITTKTRGMLARFFGIPATQLEPGEPGNGLYDAQSVEALAFRLATLQPHELAAIDKALAMVKDSQRDLDAPALPDLEGSSDDDVPPTRRGTA